MTNQTELDEKFMKEALKQASSAFEVAEVPIGAVIVDGNHEIIASSHNLVESYKDATAHAEMLCIQRASQQLGNWRLLDCTLYTTVEPCSMCLGAMFLSRLKRLVWGAHDFRHGACGSWQNLLECKHPIHNLEVTGEVLKEESASLLKQFFKERREVNDD